MKEHSLFVMVLVTPKIRLQGSLKTHGGRHLARPVFVSSDHNKQPVVMLHQNRARCFQLECDTVAV